MQAAVATSEIQAAEVGAAMLRQGGNAVDAALATAAALTVTEPTSNGLGGDLFALVWEGGEVHALDASGAAPAALDPDRLRAQLDADPDVDRAGGGMPTEGWAAVTVPGLVRGWQALHQDFGTRPWAALMAPAAALAREGFQVGPITAAAWARSVPRFAAFDEWHRVFLTEGSPPAAGATFRNPDLATTLDRLAAHGADDFYGGVLAQALLDHSAATGGFLSADDLRAARARRVRPLRQQFGELTVVGMTAPTQGVVALQALGILDGLPRGPSTTATHHQIEAVKLSFADAAATLADPDAMTRPVHDLLAPAHLHRQRARIRDDRALPSPPPAGIDGGTVLVCVVDQQGMACSLIQSNYMGFGSGIVVPGSGIALHNRGAGFRLAAGHVNSVAPGKRPFHTILPGLIQNAHGVGAFGCMGGQMQPQGHVQLVTALAAGRSPQAAIDAPRWRWLEDGRLLLEQGYDPAAAATLAKIGHRVQTGRPGRQFGGAQILLPTADGLLGGSDARKDGGVVPA